MLLVVICGTFNSITGKIRAVALGVYSGLISNLVCEIMYFLVYGLLLSFNVCFGRVPREQWIWVLFPRKSDELGYSTRGIRGFFKRLPGVKFAALAGIVEVSGDYLIFSTQGSLSIIMYKLLQQFIVPSTLIWSVILLRSRYILQELLAVLLVVIVAVVAIVTSSEGEGDTSGEDSVSDALIFGLAMVIQSCAFVVKELMFVEFSAHAQIKNCQITNLNVFLMSASTHFFGMLLVLPLSSLLQIIAGQDDVADILTNGFILLLSDAMVARWFAFYMTVNVLFNMSLYYLIAYASSALAFLCVTVTLPASVILSLFNWPLIGSSAVPWIQHGNKVRANLEARDNGCRRPRICCWPLRGRLQWRASPQPT
ncbi:hypothetical protein FOL46_000565 [Perkinsus olseni]|uniref:Uncharacterized protein n=1 Tax=Perkinsus olseni TaxID=32597 RepID=A0A7J6MHC6_PEROL|nr:hypothetical protein FOL46_000565 [Perkinsus olseni]